MAQLFSQFGTWLRRHRSKRQPRLFINSHGVTRELVPGSDQRRYARFPVYLAVSYDAIGEDQQDSRIYNGFVLNASQGGLFITSEQPFPKGSFLHIHFFISPDEELLGSFVGKVVDVDMSSRHPHGMHIKLLGYSADMKKLISYLEEKFPLLDHME